MTTPPLLRPRPTTTTTRPNTSAAAADDDDDDDDDVVCISDDAPRSQRSYTICTAVLSAEFAIISVLKAYTVLLHN